jgi:Putative Flp pilus-assembly TadE/G-like
MPALIRTRSGERGQALVLMVGGMVAVIAMVALIVDGGNAWSQQRIVQNGSDAAAEAGAIVMAQRFAGASTPALGWDATVQSAIGSTSAANGITIAAAYYTDICGIPLRPDGSAALNADGSANLAVADQVGSGNLPATISTTPDCPSHLVGPAAGVMVLGRKMIQTYLAGAVGLNAITVSKQSTAAAGYLQESCSSDQGPGCAVLPVTIPVDIVSCDGSNNPVDTGTPWVLGQVYKVPLCKNGPGNVGWLDWTPPGGGTSELIQSIQTPDNPAISLPSWQYVTSTGNPNSAGVETAIRAYDGQVVLIPQFDLTCNTGNNAAPPDSTSPAIKTAPNYGCPAGDLGGNGQNQWYRLPSFAHFQLCISTDAACVAVGASFGAYTNGNNSSVCDTGNGATSCLVGRFVRIESSGTIGPGVGGGSSNTKSIGVQLIR